MTRTIEGRTHRLELQPRVLTEAGDWMDRRRAVWGGCPPHARDRGLKERMGWELIPWYTITDDFDEDFGVDQWHGHNAFIREGDRIFRTYFVDARGDEHMGTTWSYLDTTRTRRTLEGWRPGTA